MVASKQKRVTAAEYNAMVSGKSKYAVKRPKTPSPLEEELLQQIQLRGLPEPEREYKFIKDRRFRSDFAYPKQKILLEVEGGVWTNGRHTRGAGYANDCKKYNLASMHGWLLLRFTDEVIKNGEAVLMIEEALESRDRV